MPLLLFKQEMSLRKASTSFGIPKDALHRRVTSKLKSLPDKEPHKNVLGGYRPVLSNEQEKHLEEHILKMDEAFYGLSIIDIRSIVFDYCKENNIPNSFNTEKKMAGRDFIPGFLKRHPTLSLRKPEAVSLNRVYGCNRTSTMKYFDNLETLLNRHNFQAHEIFNCDESGLTCVHKPVKVITQKGKRCVTSATSGERGQTTTILVACSASGVYVPPMMIFKRKRNKAELVDHAPAGTIANCSPNGWIDSDLFLDYLKHFVAHVKCRKDSPVLLILDGHKTHTKNIATIDYARDNGVVMLSLPPHTSHKLQPLDRSFFKPLKSAFNVSCCTWLRKHPGRRITVDILGELFNTAYLKAATMENAVSGFKCTGIVPYNRNILPDTEFLSDPREDDCIGRVQNTARNLFASEAPSPVLQLVSNKEQSPSTSFSNIMNVPKLPGRKQSKRSEESVIVTSSPYKESLCQSMKRKDNKMNKTGKKAAKKAKKDKENEDTQCPMCDRYWSQSTTGEEWVKCEECEQWFHEECCSDVTAPRARCDLCA